MEKERSVGKLPKLLRVAYVILEGAGKEGKAIVSPFAAALQMRAKEMRGPSLKASPFFAFHFRPLASFRDEISVTPLRALLLFFGRCLFIIGHRLPALHFQRRRRYFLFLSRRLDKQAGGPFTFALFFANTHTTQRNDSFRWRERKPNFRSLWGKKKGEMTLAQ